MKRLVSGVVDAVTHGSYVTRCCFRESLGLEDLPDLMVTLVIRYPWQLRRLGHVQSNEFSFKNALLMHGFFIYGFLPLHKRFKTLVVAFLASNSGNVLIMQLSLTRLVGQI